MWSMFSMWFFAEKHLFVMHMPYLFFHNILFRAFRLFDVLLLCLDWHTQQLAFRSSRLSSCPKPFCLLRCEVDDLWENRLCHRNVCCLPHPRKHRQFESPAKDCPYWCRRVPTFRRTGFWACCNKIIHQDFAIFEDWHPHLHRLVQLHPISADADTYKVVCELRAPRKQRACNQFAIFPLSSLRIIFLSMRFCMFSIVHQTPHCSWACRSFFENSLLRAFWILHFCTSSLSISYIGVGKLILA